MPPKTGLWFVCLLGLYSGCLTNRFENDSSKNLIFGGELVSSQNSLDFQHVAAMLRIDANGKKEHFCTVSVVGPYQGVTAAHCIQAAKDEMRFDSVKFAIAFPKQDGQQVKIDFANLRRIVNWRAHPEFEAVGSNFNGEARVESDIKEIPFSTFDVGFLEWEGELPSNILPVKIANLKPLEKGTKVTLIGFGRTVNEGKVDGKLRKVDTSVFANWNKTSDSIIVGEIFKRGACEGDSGGPLFFKQDSMYFLYGVTSYGVIGGKCKGGLTAYTDISKYRSWISENMRFDFDTQKPQVVARPQGTFTDWCRKDHVDQGSKKLLNILLEIAETKDCKVADGYLSRLTVLDLSGKGIDDVSGLSTLNQINSLTLDDNQVRDLSALQFFPNLKFFSVSQNGLESLTSIRGSAFPNLTYVRFANNNIKDDAPLQSLLGVGIIEMENNPLTSKGCPWGRSVECRY